jgi:hypothetical protein
VPVKIIPGSTPLTLTVMVFRSLKRWEDRQQVFAAQGG